MKDDPCTGDWCEMVNTDFDTIDVHMSDDQIANMGDMQYKTLIKKQNS